MGDPGGVRRQQRRPDGHPDRAGLPVGQPAHVAEHLGQRPGRSSSITMTGSPSTVSTSNTVTTYGLDNAATARASRSARCRSCPASFTGSPGGRVT